MQIFCAEACPHPAEAVVVISMVHICRSIFGRSLGTIWANVCIGTPPYPLWDRCTPLEPWLFRPSCVCHINTCIYSCHQAQGAHGGQGPTWLVDQEDTLDPSWGQCLGEIRSLPAIGRKENRNRPKKNGRRGELAVLIFFLPSPMHLPWSGNKNPGLPMGPASVWKSCSLWCTPRGALAPLGKALDPNCTNTPTKTLHTERHRRGGVVEAKDWSHAKAWRR